MKTIIFFLFMVSIGFSGQAQAEFGVTINKTVRIDSSVNICSKRWDLKLPTNNDFFITDDKFVNNIMDKWDYWDGFFEGHQTTLYIYNGLDSVLYAESADNTFRFTKVGDKWHMKNFIIKATNMSLNHIACGLTSKEVFKILNKKIKKEVGDGQVLLSNKDRSYLFILTFSKDKLVSMQL